MWSILNICCNSKSVLYVSPLRLPHLYVNRCPWRSTHATQHRGGKMRMQESNNDHQSISNLWITGWQLSNACVHLCRCFNTSQVLKLPFMSSLPVYWHCESSYLTRSTWLISSVSLVIIRKLRHTFITTWPLEMFHVVGLFLTPAADFLELFLT